eukprot:6647859-Prorocentrum_lima.AAC.1
MFFLVLDSNPSASVRTRESAADNQPPITGVEWIDTLASGVCRVVGLQPLCVEGVLERETPVATS